MDKPIDVFLPSSPGPPASLAWTTEKPTVPGWYWFMSEWYSPGVPLPTEIVESEYDGRLEFYLPPTSEPFAVVDCLNEWAGPIEPPEE